MVVEALALITFEHPDSEARPLFMFPFIFYILYNNNKKRVGPDAWCLPRPRAREHFYPVRTGRYRNALYKKENTDSTPYIYNLLCKLIDSYPGMRIRAAATRVRRGSVSATCLHRDPAYKF